MSLQLYGLFCVMLALTLGILLVPAFRTKDVAIRQRQMFLAFIITVSFALFFFIYFLIGAPGIVPMLADRDVKMEALKTSIAKHSEEVKTNPKDMAAWVALGQDFMETGQYKGASNAFKQAVLLSRGNPLIILAYASSLISGANGQVTDEAKKSLEMVLLQQPDNPEARYLLAVRLLQDGKNEEAMKAMKDLYQSLPENSPMRTMIDKQIGRK